MAARSRTTGSGSGGGVSSSSSWAMMMEDNNNNDTVAAALYWDIQDRLTNSNRDSSSNRLVMNGDDNDDTNIINNNHKIAEHVLNACGDMLTRANDVLDDVDEDMLGSAIQRGCTDLANAIGSLAHQLENQSEDERRDLAQACLQDVAAAAAAAVAAHQQQEHNDCLLQQIQQQQQPPGAAAASASSLVEWHNEFSTMNESQLVQVIVAAGCFLRDVEETLRAVENDEAQELAEVALTVAKIFVESLQSMHAQLCPQDLLISSGVSGGGLVGGLSSSTVRIELLEEDDNDDDDDDNDGTNEEATTPRSDRNQQAKKQQQQQQQQHRKKQMNDRLRVLWPPLGPAVSKSLAWGKEAAMSQPLFAIALAMILWPAAVTTAIVGTPLVLVDGCIQNMYSHFQDVPLLVGLERGAAQVFHTGRLALVSGKVLGRHSLRVLKRQIDRNGGVGHIATHVAGMAVDRIMHPMETIGWSVDQIKRVLQHLTDQEREKTVLVQVLQQ